MKRCVLIIFCAMLSVLGMAQSSRVVKGMVMSVDEEPLSGATIRVPGSNSSVVSSYDGRFEIKAPVSANEIEASKDGYLDAKAEIDGTFIIFKLKLDRKSYRNKRSGGNAKRDAELEARLTALENANANKSRQDDSSVDEKELEKKLRAKMEAEIRAELEAEIRAKLEAEEKAKAEAAERARIEAEEKAKAEAAERARIEAEEKAKAEAAERARIEAEEKAKAEAAERARIEAEEKAKAEAAERARIEAEEKAKAEAAERARIEAEEKAKAEAAERARIEAEEKAKAEAAERARIEAEEKAKAEAAKRAKAKVEMEAVDLGLPSGNKWASCNLGASAPEERGDYFAWGETETKVNYSEFNSKTRDKRIRRIAGNGVYDAAAAKLGAGWQMPTKDDFEELIKNCTWVLTNVNGVDGFLVTGYTGNSIFLPTTGYRDGMSLCSDDKLGEYWTSTPHRDTEYSYYLCYNGENYYVFWNCRYVGRCIRPVKKR